MWCLFGYYWLVVSRHQITRSSLEALCVLALIIIIGLILTFWWVAHNKKLARRNRRNSPPATTPETFDSDFLGRPLVRPDVGLLQKAQVIDIGLEPGLPDAPDDPGKKIYSLGEKDGF